MLDENERVSSEDDSYYLHLYVADKEKKYVYTCDNQDEYNVYTLDDEVFITVSAGMVVEIKTQN